MAVQIFITFKIKTLIKLAMKRIINIVGVTCIILGLIAMFFLLAKGFNFYEIDNRKIIAGLAFVAILFPTIGIQILRKNKL